MVWAAGRDPITFNGSAMSLLKHGEKASGGGVSRKGLAEGSMGLMGLVTVGVSCVAPAYALTATLGPTASVVGQQMPAVFLLGFLPMLLVALGYRELNQEAPCSGTSFTWAT